MSKLLADKSEPDQIIMNRLAIVLKEERVTNRDLAAQLGYVETTISKWATNRLQPPISTFLRIALILNRDLPDLFVSTKRLDEAKRAEYLATLAEIAEKGKRTGKSKKTGKNRR